jgi:hypothetical protein
MNLWKPGGLALKIQLGRRQGMNAHKGLGYIILIVLSQVVPCLAAAPSAEQVVRDLSAIESRVVGSRGLDKAADYVEKAFREAGLLEVKRQPFRMAAPVEEHASLNVNGETFPLHAIFPNNVRTSSVPKGGLKGALLYAGKGDLTDLDGKEVKGCIVLLDFNSGDNWVNAFSLGAKAVIFIAPESTSRQEAEEKFLSVPMNAPRFWLEREAGLRLITRAGLAPSSKLDSDETKSRVNPVWKRAQAPLGVVHARVVWKPTTCYNIWGKISGGDPQLKEEHIVLSAYYDAMSVVPARAPGAESACGIAALIELAQTLKAQRPKRTIVFVATSAHFMGLAGAGYYSRGFEIAKTEGGAKVPDQIDPDGKKTQGIIAFYKRYFSTFEDADKKPAAVFIGLDLSSQTRLVGLFARGSYEDNRDIARERSYAYIGRAFHETLRAMEREGLGLRVKGSSRNPQPSTLNPQPDELFADTINPIQGRSADTYFPELPAFDSEVVSFFSGAVTLATCSDNRNFVDTPFDTAERVNFENLRTQVEFLGGLLSRTFSDPEFPVWIQEPTLRNKKPLFGQVVTADPRKNIVPSKPVPGTVVVALRDLGARGSFMRSNPKPIYGVHPHGYAIAEGDDAWYNLLHFQWPGNARLEAFHLNEDGEIDYAPDLGSDGNAKYNFRQFRVEDKAGKVLNYVIFPCVSVTLMDLVDPRYLLSLQNLKVLDADTESDPHYYGTFLPLTTRYDTSYVEPVAMVFVQKDAKIKVLMSLGLVGFRLVLINADLKRPQFAQRWNQPPLQGLLAMKKNDSLGRGFRITQPMIFPDAALQVTKDLWVLNDSRMTLLAHHGISNDRLSQLHKLSLDALATAARAKQARRWSVARAETNQAWAFESTVYPDVTATANDVVKGVLFYLFLVLPFAYFVERLLFGFPDIRKQIVSVAAIFTVVLVILAFVHPAFKITMTPFLIFLAFTIITLAAVVIGIVLVKFSAELQRYRGGMAGVHHVDVNRIGALTAALNLGIANMRRRALRTVLTCATLILLTFTVLSFTSLKSYVRFNKYELPWKGSFDGILFRSLSWGVIEEVQFRQFKAQLGDQFHLAPRSWLISRRPEDGLVIEVKRTEGQERDTALLDAVVGLSENEPYISGVDKMLAAGRWFGAGERDACILSQGTARVLKIRPADVEKATVNLFGTNLKVVGIFDEDKVNKWRGLAEEWLTPVNFQVLRPVIRSRDAELNPEQLAREKFMFWPSNGVLFVPHELLMDNGGTLRAISAVPRRSDFRGLNLEKFLQDALRRWAVVLFAGMNGRAYLYSSMGSQSLSGLTELIIPLIIGALIILNTMLGSVYERIKEISIYSSIGLSPLHTASLFIAEAAVYATIGSISGYLIGQVLSKIITTFNLLPGLTLNYSAMSAVIAILLVIVVVFLSALYPARQAMRLAVPDIGAAWQVGAPEGDEWAFRLPFQVHHDLALALVTFLRNYFAMHSEQAIGVFYTAGARIYKVEDGSLDGTGYGLTFTAWLAPYDFGVSQWCLLETVPSMDEGTFEFKLAVQRLSGDVPSWRRANKVFLNNIRKQFLIWRTVKPEDRAAYQEEGERLLTAEAITTN